jgi:hypothetical protein
MIQIDELIVAKLVKKPPSFHTVQQLISIRICGSHSGG